jgi:anti-sigma factor RsiW
MSLHPDKLLLIHGLVDGELDAANTIAIEAHLKGCVDCRAELQQIRTVRDMLAAAPLHERAPEGLYKRVNFMIDAEAGPAPRRSAASGRPSFEHGRFAWAGSGAVAHVFSGRWASGLVTGLIAASLLLAVVMPQLTHTDMEDQLVQSHVRSLLVGHLVDIPTSNRHVVKPWFNGKVDFAPPVPDLADEGFPLVGGRLDYIDDHEIAAIVYRRRLHVINLFVRPAHTLALPGGEVTRHEGYSLSRWTGGGLEYWAVSDIDPADLKLFRQVYVSRATP